MAGKRGIADSIPSVTSPSVPPDVRRAFDRVREATQKLEEKGDRSVAGLSVLEGVPSVMVGSFYIASAAASTNYEIGEAQPPGGDPRIRVAVTAGATGAAFTITRGSNTYSKSLSARETWSFEFDGDPESSVPVYVQSDTGSIAFSAYLFVPNVFTIKAGNT